MAATADHLALTDLPREHRRICAFIHQPPDTGGLLTDMVELQDGDLILAAIRAGRLAKKRADEVGGDHHALRLCAIALLHV